MSTDRSTRDLNRVDEAAMSQAKHVQSTFRETLCLNIVLETWSRKRKSETNGSSSHVCQDFFACFDEHTLLKFIPKILGHSVYNGELKIDHCIVFISYDQQWKYYCN